MAYSRKDLKEIVMNKTLKTYEDGSELTVLGIAASAGIALVATAAWVGVLEWRERRRERRYLKVLNNNSE